MIARLTDEVRWIGECYDLPREREAHLHVSVYLLGDRDDYVLVDSGSFYHREAIRAELDDVTDGAGVDAIVLSHADLPHSGNVSAFIREWDDAELVFSSTDPAIQGFEGIDVRRSTLGADMDVCGRTLSFIDPPLADRSHSTWVFDGGSEVLFTADGFGNYHSPGECGSEFGDAPGDDGFRGVLEFNRDNLRWLRYADPDALREALDAVVEAYDPAYIAPIHGHPVPRGEVGRRLDQMEEAARRIARAYDVSA